MTLKLNLIENPDNNRERNKFRYGLHYFSQTGVFLSTTDQIHICAYSVRFPQEVNEGTFTHAWMENLLFTKCELVAPFKRWLSKESVIQFSDYPISISKQFCRRCGTFAEFERILTVE